MPKYDVVQFPCHAVSSPLLERASCAFHHSVGRKLCRCLMSPVCKERLYARVSRVEMHALPVCQWPSLTLGRLSPMATKGACVCALLAPLLRHAGSWAPHPSHGVLLRCREVVIQWTDGYPRRSTVLVNLGTTPQLGQRFDGTNGSSVTDASYTRADMLGPRANLHGYFWPGAHTLRCQKGFIGFGVPFNPYAHPVGTSGRLPLLTT